MPDRDAGRVRGNWPARTGFSWAQSWGAAWRVAVLNCGLERSERLGISAEISVEVHIASGLEKVETLFGKVVVFLYCFLLVPSLTRF